ncbi:MAG TPA: deoxyguanosinetriphosphate triphosphohydrolase [Verrucomicrobiae bacterium]|nr:deoxyguanosinetriphosphate triphosphohydrolase [Verrucomicrobiae bacterium]
MLASYAVRIEDSRGRRYPEPPHPYRNPFQRDRDRVIHARAFRRLENKTQVFTRRYSDHFRTRLTHTIEVTQISRTIAAQLNLNVDLTEALALVHDIGHPPFGHAGERTLDLLMRQHGGFFDHNLQALRTVEEMELRYAEFHGLNLTFEVREGIIKHSHDYSAVEHPELAEYLLELRPPLEAQLIDLTDEIAYNTADLDDGFEAKLLKLPQIREHVTVFERYYREAEAKYPDAPDKLKFNEALKQVLNRFVTDLIENTRRRVEESGVKTLEELRKYSERLAGFSPEVEAERLEAKRFLSESLYNIRQLEPEKRQAEQVITDVFNHLVAHPEALPRMYQERTENEKLVRVVCDYLGGMTDHYIEDLRKKLLAGKKAEAPALPPK